jgi:hypothetical protein
MSWAACMSDMSSAVHQDSGMQWRWLMFAVSNKVMLRVFFYSFFCGTQKCPAWVMKINFLFFSTQKFRPRSLNALRPRCISFSSYSKKNYLWVSALYTSCTKVNATIFEAEGFGLPCTAWAGSGLLVKSRLIRIRAYEGAREVPDHSR